MSIEEEFKAVYEAHKDEILSLISEAAALVTKAEVLSEQYGIPFRAKVSPLSQSYIPESLAEKFPELDSDKLWELGCDVTVNHEYHDTGWAHSAVCY